MRLLREKYRTWEGAHKRARFENALAAGEYARGDKARLYRYEVLQDCTTSEVHFRVARHVDKRGMA